MKNELDEYLMDEDIIESDENMVAYNIIINTISTVSDITVLSYAKDHDRLIFTNDPYKIIYETLLDICRTSLILKIVSNVNVFIEENILDMIYDYDKNLLIFSYEEFITLFKNIIDNKLKDLIESGIV